MKKKFFLFCLLLVTASTWGQRYDNEDQYPETDRATEGNSELSPPHRLPSTDYEEVPREEQEYQAQAPAVTDDLTAPEEAYEADEEYLE